jgi:hypothetical protein
LTMTFEETSLSSFLTHQTNNFHFHPIPRSLNSSLFRRPFQTSRSAPICPDAFTKEEKDTEHFITCRDMLVTATPKTKIQDENTSTDQSKNIVTPCDSVGDNGKKYNTVEQRSIIRDAADVTDTSSRGACYAEQGGCYRTYVVR